MALNGEPQQQSPQPYRWTDEDTEALIRWRGANDVFFTGRRNASVSGFQTYIKDMEAEGKVEALWAKKKWENLKQKYKELKAPRTGVSTEGGEATAANWKWFVLMDEVMGHRPAITPPNPISSAMGTNSAAVASLSSGERGESTLCSKRKR
ncbi:unnamed protein product [Boreogadus saida]